MDLVVYDDDEKRYVPWLVALAAVLLVTLLTATLTFVLVRQASGAQDEPLGGVSAAEPATAPSAAPSASLGADAEAACAEALRLADVGLQQSRGVEQALADHTGIMDELLAQRITAEQALERTLPVLTNGATERERLDEAVAAYQAARPECPN